MIKKYLGFTMLLLIIISASFITTIYANTTLITPEIKLCSVFDNMLLFEWKAVDGATSYDVKIDGITKNTANRYYLMENINKSKTYTFSIRSKNLSSISQWSQTSSILPNSLVQRTRFSIAQNGQIEDKYIPNKAKNTANSLQSAQANSMMSGTSIVQSAAANTQNTYIIYTADELYSIRYDLDGYYELANDIDLQGIDWESIGDWGNEFTGTIDGKGHTIKNLYTSDLNIPFQGF